MRGRVKFWKADKGWGAILSEHLPAGEDAFAHFSAIDSDGWRDLDAGDVVEFDARAAQQDSFRWVAERVRLVEHGPAPTLRRRGDGTVAVAPDDAPDTPLVPRSTEAGQRGSQSPSR